MSLPTFPLPFLLSVVIRVTLFLSGREREGGAAAHSSPQCKGPGINDVGKKHSFQLFVVLLYTCPVSYQLVSPSFAHATPTYPSLRTLDGNTTAVSREAWATLPESSSRPLPATLALSRDLAHASLETTVAGIHVNIS